MIYITESGSGTEENQGLVCEPQNQGNETAGLGYLIALSDSLDETNLPLLD